MILHKLKAALLALAIGAAAVVPANALVTDPTKTIPARVCAQAQTVCYERVTVNFNDPRIASGVWFGTLPQNAYILSMDAYVTTAFNAGTTNVITLGATAASANEISASGTIVPATPGVQHLTAAAGLGLAVTGNTTYQTAVGSAVPLYVKYTQTGTAASAGAVTIVIAYVMNNDN